MMDFLKDGFKEELKGEGLFLTWKIYPKRRRNLSKLDYNSLSEGFKVNMTKKKRENNVIDAPGMHWERIIEIKETTKHIKLSTIQS